jgi:hypothetical protein
MIVAPWVTKKKEIIDQPTQKAILRTQWMTVAPWVTIKENYRPTHTKGNSIFCKKKILKNDWKKKDCVRDTYLRVQTTHECFLKDIDKLAATCTARHRPQTKNVLLLSQF